MSTASLMPIENGFRVQGQVGFENVLALRRQGEKQIAQSASTQPFVIDLSAMMELDAACFSLLFSWMRVARKKKQTVTLINVQQSLQRMAKMFGLAALI
ncbi:MAG: hypothetical protein COY58_06840 [Gammaproteobacteria bacterium CG_4_10_14_0_8_um_filter_38_16]|nr:MAG: hypothetical protein COY58_06840 [Gammaproteobacteria bacterium CG_4_10_14_0_8_um_filter_38_16]PJA04180.1 MAG: hypothetical protein COX72_00985 [Gammaproteobacteria bacterium CG_4_10_14_0_2_um_filter_38_22]PJB10359.1 MAG: hypothetical protein CO120_05220 [Gammaproteobacteria bacterium CG_4_9_14_3_um_filter_38_9]